MSGTAHSGNSRFQASNHKHNKKSERTKLKTLACLHLPAPLPVWAIWICALVLVCDLMREIWLLVPRLSVCNPRRLPASKCYVCGASADRLVWHGAGSLLEAVCGVEAGSGQNSQSSLITFPLPKTVHSSRPFPPLRRAEPVLLSAWSSMLRVRMSLP